MPILVGGTGLYIDAVLFDFKFIDARKLGWAYRLFYPWWSIEKLQKIIQQRDWPLPENRLNRRHLINTLRRKGRVGDKNIQPRPNTIIIGLLPLDNVLRQRIENRAELIFQQGILGETKVLIKKHGKRKFLKTSGIIYKICLDIFSGRVNQGQALELFKKS